MTVLSIVREALVQQMLAVNLQQIGLLVTWENDIEKAYSALQSVTPDLIVLDSASVPGQRNVLANHLYAHARNNGIPLITLVGQGDRYASEDGVWPGEIVTKPFAPRQLLDLVRSVLQNDAASAPDASIRAGGILLNQQTHRASHGQTEISLRPKEFHLLAYLMQHVDRVFNRSQLLDAIWGDAVFVDERAVDVIVRRLRAALEPHGLADWIETVRGAGYRFRACPSVRHPQHDMAGLDQRGGAHPHLQAQFQHGIIGHNRVHGAAAR